MDDLSVDSAIMPLDLLQEITNDFSEKRMLGSGSFGKVYLGVYPDGKKIAVKMLKEMQGIDNKEFQDELKIMTKLRHKNIVQLVGYCHDIQQVPVMYNGQLVLANKISRALCLEYMSNGSLDKLLSDKCDRYNWQTCYQIIKGICQGLNYLHNELKPHIYHLDLKPANVLLDENMVPRIADFGISRLFGDEQTQCTQSVLGTLGYSPPEFIDRRLISNKFDIYSLGVIIQKIMAGRSGYSNSAEMPAQQFINLVHTNWTSRLHGRSNLRKAYSEQVKICIELGLSCGQNDRHKRPTIQDVVDMLNETETKCTYASKKDSLLIYQDCYIPDYLLKPDCEQVIVDHTPRCPVIVFINPRSGSRLGSILIKTYREILNEAQVFDLTEESPDVVLNRLYFLLEKLMSKGDTLAIQIQSRLRLIVAGGDGTASWLLGVVSDLKLSHPPPVVIVPLGTENNLAFSLGWGKKNPATDPQAVKSFLALVKGAREMDIDSWDVVKRMRTPQEGSCDPIAPLEVPHSLHAFHRVPDSSFLNVEGCHTFRGRFWNYFSMGMDARVSYKFQSARQRNPGKVTDQGIYKPGYKEGWFPASLSQTSSRNIPRIAKVMSIKRPNGTWAELMIPRRIQSIVCLNSTSYSGGLNPWGKPGSTKKKDRELTVPYVDDGLIEVVGFERAWHGIDLLAPNGHGVRLAQVHRILFAFYKGEAEHTFMEIDGEPWKQPLPKDDETVVVEISHCRQVTVLANDPCRSRSINDPSSSSSHCESKDDDHDSLDDEDEWEERRKFGATLTDIFKLPDEVEIDHLS